MVQWEEYINHNTPFSINISLDSDQTFENLARVNDTALNATWSLGVPIPVMTMRRATIQMVQGTAYYSCADILVLDAPITGNRPLPVRSEPDGPSLIMKGEYLELISPDGRAASVALRDIRGVKILDIPWPAGKNTA